MRILFAGETIAVSELRLSVLETSHRPSTTSSPDDIQHEPLFDADG